MSPYGEIWSFTRERLAQAFQDLSQEQLLWRPFPECHNIGEMLYHVAGVEVWFATRMSAVEDDPEFAKLSEAARAAYITSDPFPYGDAEMTLEKIDAVLATSGRLVSPVMSSPSESQLTMEVETVIGPVVPGVACLWRVAQHAAYHTGQIWTYRLDPRFPAA